MQLPGSLSRASVCGGGTQYFLCRAACRSASEGSFLPSLAQSAMLQDSAVPLSVLATPAKRTSRASMK